ncbi:hypothetical protein VP01_2378g4 [Puccinia sorghi]|uniref:DDE Tnp4 domain-containing protein n=1 Tax=Puccinia sorghi TaxID=27349 RepID=A0A0L6V711_9BASI|nr:hypothetical protein VP01_2378g4 [Puccinia sorghi]
MAWCSVYAARFKDSNNGSQSEASDIEELVMALLSIKRRPYLAERFKQEFRMTQESFFSLLSLIKNHPILHNNSNVPQQPVRDQLMVTSRRMGMSGNGSAISDLAQFFRISEGAVVLYCSHVVEAILALESRYVVWPNHEAQEEIAAQIGDLTGFKSCLEFINGTLLLLDKKLVIDPQDYYLRKGSYGLARLIVCDAKNHLANFLLGILDFLPRSILCLHSKKHHRPMLQLKKKFNQHLAALWVCNEHCIETMKRIIHWVSACVVLHNFLSTDSSLEINHGSVDITAPIDKVDLPQQGANSAGNQFQDHVMNDVLDYLGVS